MTIKSTSEKVYSHHKFISFLSESLRICSWRQKNEQGEVESAMLQSENRTEQQRKPPNPIHKGQDFREEIAPAYEGTL